MTSGVTPLMQPTGRLLGRLAPGDLPVLQSAGPMRMTAGTGQPADARDERAAEWRGIGRRVLVPTVATLSAGATAGAYLGSLGGFPGVVAGLTLGCLGAAAGIAVGYKLVRTGLPLRFAVGGLGGMAAGAMLAASGGILGATVGALALGTTAATAAALTVGVRTIRQEPDKYPHLYKTLRFKP